MKTLLSICRYLFWFSCTITLSNTAKADEVLMAFSLDIPPYIFEQYNKGIEIDIIAAALTHKGHTLRPLYFPLGRIPIAFQNNLVDAAMGDMGIDLTPHGGFYADPAVIYDNIFITLKKKKLVINSPTDLDELTIISFQGAEKRYPQWLKTPFDQQRFYGISDQLTQVKLLNLERYDVVLSDRYIFKYFVKQLKYEDNIQVNQVDEHHFAEIDPLNYRPVFRNQQIRDDFNLGLKKLKESGEFQAIYDHYIK